jgi:hypothetical protein
MEEEEDCVGIETQEVQSEGEVEVREELVFGAS